MSEEKFSKCEEKKKSLSVEFRVFGKKRKLKEKFRKKKNEVFFALHKKNEVKKKIAKFAFTGWALG